ncbi:MAG: hypothetical protein LH618_12945 [Saprospiraceae bacterium]|nr:hypothetical protein [Saprospiraceae bacterium]
MGEICEDSPIYRLNKRIKVLLLLHPSCQKSILWLISPPFAAAYCCCLLPPWQIQPGTLDNGFGDSGKVTTNFATGNDSGQAVAVQSDGKIVTAGFTGNGADYDGIFMNHQGFTHFSNPPLTVQNFCPKPRKKPLLTLVHLHEIADFILRNYFHKSQYKTQSSQLVF